MLSTGRMDKNGVLIEEMDYIAVKSEFGTEYGLVVYNEALETFVFANDFLVQELNKFADEEITVLMKHTKVDDFFSKIFFAY